MGSNDHQPVPDPAPYQDEPPEDHPDLSSCPEGTKFIPDPEPIPQSDVGSRVAQLEDQVEALISRSRSEVREIDQLEVKLGEVDGRLEDTRTVVTKVIIGSELVRLLNKTRQLETQLKETIRAVERLAKGKSLGCLGLPTEESWDPPA